MKNSINFQVQWTENPLVYIPLPLLKLDRLLSFLYESSDDVEDVFESDDDEFNREAAFDSDVDDEFNVPDELDLEISDFVAEAAVEELDADGNDEFDDGIIDVELNDPLGL